MGMNAVVLGNQHLLNSLFSVLSKRCMVRFFSPPLSLGHLEHTYSTGTWGPSSIDSTGIGGSEESVIFLSRELVRQGFVVRVYCYLKAVLASEI